MTSSCSPRIGFLLLLTLMVSGTSPDLQFLQSGSHHDRSYLLDAPATLDQEKRYPLVLVFHGASSNAKMIREVTGLSQSPYRDSILFAYPNSKVENWEEGCRCNKPYRLGVKDVDFVDNLIAELSGKFPVNPSRIYAVGYSQGGMFVHNLACKLSSRFSAVASVSSSMSLPLSRDCKEASNLSILMIHGKRDPILPYHGTFEDSFSLLSTPATAAFWGKQLKLKQTDKNRTLGRTVTLDRYGSENGNEVLLFSIEDGGHSWSFPGLYTSETIMRFFLSKQKDI